LVFVFKLKRGTNSLKNSGALIKLLVIWESVSAALAYLASFALQNPFGGGAIPWVIISFAPQHMRHTELFPT
jgi:hypothetical protein